MLNTFEDLGFYCVDNLPVALIPKFTELYEENSGEIERAALLVDAREGEQIEKLPGIVRKLRSRPSRDAGFHGSQRRGAEAPLQRNAPPASAWAAAARSPKAFAPSAGAWRPSAGSPTWSSTPRDSTSTSCGSSSPTAFRVPDRSPLLISAVSFGFRYGIPSDADLVFDVRFLPNPHFVPRLRPFSGKDARVARYIRSFPQTGEFLRRIESLLGYLIPHYIREGKSYLTVALGCTGGRHRSVALAEVIARALKRKGYATKVVHRDLDKSLT